ncbi:MAG: hypothetical protein IKX44_01700 [Prevotella sp.]|nr:hypothetical protein [Prevotella sp.]
MMNKRNITRFLLATALLAVLISVSIIVVKHQKEKETERRLEARFDKFMGYYYPYLKEISNAARIYERMQISLMYDYLTNHKGRYIYEIVNYHDGGAFSMSEEFKLGRFLDQSSMLCFGRASAPINSAPLSRENEKMHFYKILDTTSKLIKVDIYDDNIGLNKTAEQTREFLDSLNLEIQSNFHSLVKYRDSSAKIDLNTISESDYDINNY